MTEREKLVKEIETKLKTEWIKYSGMYSGGIVEQVICTDKIADFIIARDKKRAGESVTLEALKANPIYKHIDIDAEFNKAKQWIARTGGRKLTSRFFVNWLNRIEKPLEKKVEREAF